MVGRYCLRTTSFFCQSTFLLPFVFVSIGRSVRDDFLVVGGHLFDLLLRGTVVYVSDYIFSSRISFRCFMGGARAVILMAAETPCIKYLFVTLIEISVLVYHDDGALLVTVDIIIFVLM